MITEKTNKYPNLDDDVFVRVSEVEVSRLHDIGRLLGVDHHGQGEEDLGKRSSLNSFDSLLMNNLIKLK